MAFVLVLTFTLFSAVFQTFSSSQNTDAGSFENSVIYAVEKKYPGVRTPADRYQTFKLALNDQEGIDSNKLFEAISHIKFAKEARTFSRDLLFKIEYLQLFDEENNKNKDLILALKEKAEFLRKHQGIYSGKCCNLCSYYSELNLGQPPLNPELSKLIDEDLHLKLSRHNYPKTRLQEFSKALDDNDIKKAFLIAEYFYYNVEAQDVKNILLKKIGTLNPLISNNKSELSILLNFLNDYELLTLLRDYESSILNFCCCFCFCNNVIYDGECGEVCCYKFCCEEC